MSGIARYEFSTSASGPWTTCSNPFIYSTEINATHYYRAVNGAGLAGAASVANTVKIDKTPPYLKTFTKKNGSVSGSSRKMTFTVEYADDLSGIKSENDSGKIVNFIMILDKNRNRLVNRRAKDYTGGSGSETTFTSHTVSKTEYLQTETIGTSFQTKYFVSR